MTTITVWADIRCPWCWIGHRRLGAALERLGQAGQGISVVHRSFLLEPTGPDTPGQLVSAALKSSGMSEAQWQATRRRVANGGHEEGLEIEMDGTLRIDSRPSHRLIKLATVRGADPELAWERFFTAHLGHHENLEDRATLRGIGTELGLDGAEVDALLDSDEFTAEVEADHRAAVELGIGSIPSFVHEGRVLSGARSTDELVAFLSGAEALR